MDKPTKDIFKIWHFLFKRQYKLNSEEGLQRYKNFREQLKKIDTHNADPIFTWKLGLNQFSDLTQEEFVKRHTTNLGARGPPKNPPNTPIPTNGYYVLQNYEMQPGNPSTWAPINYTSICGPVWNQGLCGDCYNFASLNSIECNYNKRTGILPQLSRQQNLDCNPLSGGCGGGNAFEMGVYAKSQGLMNNADYPYTGASGTCQYNSAKAGIYLDGLEQVGCDPGLAYTTNNLTTTSAQLYSMLSRGALYTTFNTTAFAGYTSGFINSTMMGNCGNGANHAILLVGFYQDPVMGPTWVLKNSWDVTFGESGYFRVVVQDTPDQNCWINGGPARLFKN